MRFWAIMITGVLPIAGAVSACKTMQGNGSVKGSDRSESVENEEQLPACDDVTVGRGYWVRSLRAQMLCAEGGTWKPGQVDSEGNAAEDGPSAYKK